MLEVLAYIARHADTPIILIQWYMIWRLWELNDKQEQRTTRILYHVLAIRNGDVPQSEYEILPARHEMSSGGIDRDPYEDKP